jgi:hypothetical protein
MTPEQKIRWTSLLVALKALDDAGEAITIAMCQHGHGRIEGDSGCVQWDQTLKNFEGAWILDGIDGEEIFV